MAQVLPSLKKRTKKEGQVQTGKPPRLKPPRLAALELQPSRRWPLGNRFWTPSEGSVSEGVTPVGKTGDL